jgi:hypothetical protein
MNNSIPTKELTDLLKLLYGYEFLLSSPFFDQNLNVVSRLIYKDGSTNVETECKLPVNEIESLSLRLKTEDVVLETYYAYIKPVLKLQVVEDYELAIEVIKIKKQIK